MQEVYKTIGRVAATDATVLIRGETGTGKELVARAVYQHSRRSQAPLLVVNCTAIPETLLESELFGYEKGAFTGAVTRRIGKFEQAHLGTLFLDEVGDMPLSTQAKILRFLQERTFERLGSSQTLRADVRLLAATNRDLEQAMAEGLFREDLYHRLNVVTIQLPPLRERRQDIPRLIDYFLERLSRPLGIDRPPLSAQALEVLGNHPWPGNVRELEHCLQRVLIFTRGHAVQADDVQSALEREAEALLAAPDEDDLRAFVRQYLHSGAGPDLHGQFMDLADKLLVAEALRQTSGNQTRAARLLGLTRPTLQAKMQKYGIYRQTQVRED
jgi:transcriptional regulator with GAF, ATPase, and Fis domain